MLQCGVMLWLSHPRNTHKSPTYFSEKRANSSCRGVRVLHTLTAGTGFGGVLILLMLGCFTSVSPASLSFFLYFAIASVFCWRYGPKLGSPYTQTVANEKLKLFQTLRNRNGIKKHKMSGQLFRVSIISLIKRHQTYHCVDKITRWYLAN